MRASTLKRMALAGATIIGLSGIGFVSQQGSADAATAWTVHAQNRLQNVHAQNVHAQNHLQNVHAQNVHAQNRLQNTHAQNVHAQNRLQSNHVQNRLQSVHAQNRWQNRLQNVHAQNRLQSNGIQNWLRNVHAQNRLQNRLQSNHVQSRAQSARDDAQAVVAAYYTILNAGLKNGNFGMLSTVYAPDATLTQSNPKGVTTVVHGLAAITRFYQGLAMKLAWYHFTPEQVRVLAPGIVLAYEHAGPPAQKVPGRCAHLFVIQNGKIVSLDWITFYTGEK